MRHRGPGTLPLYIGGFLGPFGGGVLAVLVPQLRDAFDAGTATVAAAIPAYLVPFAVLQLVSGTVGERLGRRRVVRTGYLAYTAFSVLAAVAPGMGAFKFAGNAAAPVMWLPLYHLDPRAGFLGAAVMAALAGAFVAPLRVRG